MCLSVQPVAVVEDAYLLGHERWRIALQAASPPLIRPAAVSDASEQHPAAGATELKDIGTLNHVEGYVFRLIVSDRLAPKGAKALVRSEERACVGKLGEGVVGGLEQEKTPQKKIKDDLKQKLKN